MKLGDFLNKTNEAFSEVTDSANKVSDLISKITAASNEQANGIEQVNNAVVEMDKVTQQNAAGAEEGASVSMDMNAQAEQLKKFVGILTHLVNGRQNRTVKKAENDDKHLRLDDSPKTDSLPPDEKIPLSTSVVADQELSNPLTDKDLKDF